MLTRAHITLEEHRAQERRREERWRHHRTRLERCNRALRAKRPRLVFARQTGVLVTLARWWDPTHVLSDPLFGLLGGPGRPGGIWRAAATHAVVSICTCEHADYWGEPVAGRPCVCQLGDKEYEAYLSTIITEDCEEFVSTSLCKMRLRSFETEKEEADRLARIALAGGGKPPRRPKSVSMQGYLTSAWKKGIVERPRLGWDESRERALRVRRLLREWRTLQEIWTIERQTRHPVPEAKRRRMLRARTRRVPRRKPLTHARQMLIEGMPKTKVEFLTGEYWEVPVVVFQEAYRWGPNVKGEPPRHHRWYEMLSAGMVGVVEAAVHFDPNYGDGNVPFAEYARLYVHQEIFKVLNDRQVRVPLKKMKGGGWRNHRESLEPFTDAPKEASLESVLIGGPLFGQEDPYTNGGGSRSDPEIVAARADFEPLTEDHQLSVALDAEAVQRARRNAIRDSLSRAGLTRREIQAFDLKYNLNGKGLGPNPSFELIAARMGIQTRSAWNLIHRGWDKLDKANGKKPLFPTSSLEYWRGGERNRPAFEMAALAEVDKGRGKHRVEPVFFAADSPMKPNNGRVYSGERIRWFRQWRWERPDKSETVRKGVEKARRYLDPGPLFDVNDPRYDAAAFEWKRKRPEDTRGKIATTIQINGKKAEITEKTFMVLFVLAFAGEEQNNGDRADGERQRQDRSQQRSQSLGASGNGKPRRRAKQLAKVG